MPQHKRQIFVSNALPYANGSIHIGHMLGHVLGDIWVRYQRLRGHECYYVCAIDAHGTPIMLRARVEGIAPEQLVARMQTEHARDIADFQVGFDNFHSTHSTENRELVEEIYLTLRDNGHIERRTITQAYDEKEGLFLPDRYVRGTCPRCQTKDQHGDNCENCFATYGPLDLIDPVSVLSGTPPVARETEHYFFRLTQFVEMLREWMAGGSVDTGVRNKLEEWFETGLRDWDISRDEPYFGFSIPDAPDKFFYVWLDAPIGYLASFKHYCDRHPQIDFDQYWRTGDDTEVYHVIGKDIVYFHCLFWPAVLNGAGWRTPTKIFTHGFVTYEKKKMSKSRGTFLNARTYLNHLKPEYLRYYYFGKLAPGIDNFDFSPDDFVNRVNADLIGKFVNIASRCAGFIHKNHGGRLASELHDVALFQRFVDTGDSIAGHMESRRFGQASREIMALADLANRYIDEHKPWQMVKQDGQKEAVQKVCTQGINLFRVLLVYLQPVLPELVASAAEFLNASCTRWEDRECPLLDHTINRYKPLLQRIDTSMVAAMVAEEKAAYARAQSQSLRPTPGLHVK